MLTSLADKIMRMGVPALAAADEGGLDTGIEWVDTLIGVIKSVLVPILIVVSAAGALYSIVLGVNMARADSTEKREEAKKRLVGLIIGLVAMIALILFFLLLFPTIIRSMIGSELQ